MRRMEKKERKMSDYNFFPDLKKWQVYSLIAVFLIGIGTIIAGFLAVIVWCIQHVKIV